MAELISSLRNPRIKQAIRLRDARQRQKQGRFIVDGTRELARAVDAQVPLVEVYVCHELCTTVESGALAERMLGSSTAVFDITLPVYEKLRFGQRNDGLVAVAESMRRTLDDLPSSAEPLIAIVEGIEKPGNLGAILRSADGAGISAVIVADGGTDLYNPNAIRASLGTIFTLPIAQASSREALQWCRDRHLRILAARVDATMDYAQADLCGGVALVLGSESRGLSEVWQASDITSIRLPLLGAADSLNVSTTAAVLFYEGLRQRTDR